MSSSRQCGSRNSVPYKTLSLPRSGLMALLLSLGTLIFIHDAEAQSPREVLLTPDNAYNPMPSPDGKHIAYVRTGWGEKLNFGFGRGSLVSEVKLINAEGPAAPRILGEDYFLSGWTPDSTRVVCYRDLRYALVSLEGKQNPKGRISNNPDSYTSAEWVAYSPSLGTVIWSRPVGNSQGVIETPGRTITRERGFWNDRVVPSPDGRYLAVFADSSQTNLRIYDLRLESWTDVGPITIHPDKDWSYIQPNWSPWFADSSRLVFLRNSSLLIASADGTTEAEIKVNGPAGLPAASPDGQAIAYVTFEPRPMKVRPDLQFWGSTTIWMVRVSSVSEPRPITEKDQDEILDLKWLNNDALVFDRIADTPLYQHARIWKVAGPH